MLKTVSLSTVIEGKRPVTIEAGSTVREASRVMSQAEKGAIMVLSAGRLQGIFTERDLLKRVVAEGLDPDKVTVDDVMTRSLVVAAPQDSYQRGLQKMVKATCRHLPVVNGDKVMGLVSRRDLMKLDIELLEEELDRRDPATLFI